MTTAEPTISKRRVEIADMLRYQIVDDPQPDPAGDRVAYTVVTIEGPELLYHSAVWIAPTTGGEPRRITWSANGESRPRWSPDGRMIAVLSGVSAGGLRLIDPDDGSSREIATIPGGVSDFAWSPDGRTLVVVGSGVETPARPPEQLRITALHYKGDTLGLQTGSVNHLWLVQSDGSAAPHQLTYGGAADSAPSWSPDGRSVAFTRTRPAAGVGAPFDDVWVVDAKSGAERNLTAGHGPCFRPVWSPDGRSLAWAGHEDPNDIWWARNFGIWMMDADGGEPRELTREFDRTCFQAVFREPFRGVPWPTARWTADGRRLVFVATIGGTCHLHAVPANGGPVEPLTAGAQVICGFEPSSRGIAYCAMTGVEPPELWWMPADGLEPRRLTSHNMALMSELAVVKPEPFRFASPAGDEIEGWTLAPPTFEADGPSKRPLVLIIHGGPHTAFGESYHHSLQCLASAGYVVAYVNPHGSQGYGQAFAFRVMGDWGGVDFDDVMAGVDHLLATRADVDAARLAAVGMSYGGYMTCWIAGHTERFAAIVSALPITDLISFFGTSDIGHSWLPFEMKGALPWENRDRYVRMSPLTYVERVTTPLLLIHHEEDLRCPIAQSEQFYTSLKVLGKEVEFLRIAEASHAIAPTSRAHADLIDDEATHDWLARHLRSSNGAS